jgi:Na+-driven multidrug efflux pump
MLNTMVKLGLPMALKSTSVAFSKMFVNSYINSFGVTVSAVTGIGSKLNHMIAQCSNSFNTAGAAMVGQNIGAEKYDRVKKILISDFCIMAVIAVVCSLAMLMFPNEIFGLFTKDPEVLDVCMEFVPVALVIFIGSAFRAPSNALANGTGNYIVNFAIAILDAIVNRIGLALILGLTFGMGYLGFWLGDAIAGFTPFFIGGIFYLSGKWKTNKYVIKK